MDPQMMRHWLAGQAAKKQITEADMQRNLLGVPSSLFDILSKTAQREREKKSLIFQPLPQYTPRTDLDLNNSYITNEPQYKTTRGKYVPGQGPLSPEELDNNDYLIPVPAAAGYTEQQKQQRARDAQLRKTVKEEATFWITDGVVKDPITGKLKNKGKRLATPDEIKKLGLDKQAESLKQNVASQAIRGTNSAFARGGAGFESGRMETPALLQSPELRVPDKLNFPN
jgi:hypothetical protein